MTAELPPDVRAHAALVAMSYLFSGRELSEVVDEMVDAVAEVLVAEMDVSDRPRLQPSFWAAPSNLQSRICDLCGALVADVKPVPGSMPDARAAHERWHANHPDYRTSAVERSPDDA